MPSVTNKTPWARWYGLSRWQRRARLQLRISHVCAECTRQGRTEIATIADHIEDHKGDEYAFWYGALQSLCLRCHLAKHGRGMRDFQRDIDASGWPIDPAHPANQTELKEVVAARKKAAKK